MKWQGEGKFLEHCCLDSSGAQSVRLLANRLAYVLRSHLSSPPQVPCVDSPHCGRYSQTPS